MDKKINVEGGEIAIRNSNGDVAIIPKRHRNRVNQMIRSGCNRCVDNFVSSLPKMNDYATGGKYHQENQN